MCRTGLLLLNLHWFSLIESKEMNYKPVTWLFLFTNTRRYFFIGVIDSYGPNSNLYFTYISKLIIILLVELMSTFRVGLGDIDETNTTISQYWYSDHILKDFMEESSEHR